MPFTPLHLHESFLRLLLICTLTLSGCALDPAVMAERQRQQQEQQEQIQRAYIENLAGQCEALGYSRSSPDFKQCMLQMHQTSQNDQQARRAAAINYLISRQPAPATQTNCYKTFTGVQCNTQ